MSMPAPAPAGTPHSAPADLARFRAVRASTMALSAPLSAEDACVQSMPDASPAKWHLAHTTWFFETVVLEACAPGYRSPFPGFRVLFNSYYNRIGPQFTRAARGLLTRPSLADVQAYRAWVDERLERVIAAGPEPATAAFIELGLHHEQQHQELLLMDVKHLFSCNPLYPAYRTRAADPGARRSAVAASWMAFDGGLVDCGAGPGGFAFDNERPRHRHYLAPFALASRLVTNGEFLAFMDDDGYGEPGLWLADGWARRTDGQWKAPQYWVRRADEWLEFTLGGLRTLDPAAPVCHVSYYEADAYARWAQARLPTEFEWEHAAGQTPVRGNFVEDGWLHPRPAAPANGLVQLFGDVWEWTASAYAPYPGFSPLAGAVGEYNGKFMSNQLVLRGGCCATPGAHVRASYRNFFYPHHRWQFGGIRLAR